ncbi:cyd operon YbgE family protein [Onishia niordana]|uniref:cyd operon YbgE family protein n=1 Tax=Onishia niordana TaxID=2508711 RepID=UPI0010A08891|nr:cyd operon YbgE family protein [Halomonas niordiana]
MDSRIVRHVWLPFAALVLSSIISVVLLWRPEVLSSLSWGWRLPMVMVGVWALGAGFMHGVGLTTHQRWGQRLMAGSTCGWGLLGFAMFVLARLVVS